jgi:hypothetical protein
MNRPLPVVITYLLAFATDWRDSGPRRVRRPDPSLLPCSVSSAGTHLSEPRGGPQRPTSGGGKYSAATRRGPSRLRDQVLPFLASMSCGKS